MRYESRHRRHHRLCIEQLEDRALCATLTVTNGKNHGPGSLLDALTIANSNSEPDTIKFAPAVKTVSVKFQLSVLSSEKITLHGGGVVIKRAPNQSPLSIDATSLLLLKNNANVAIDGVTFANNATVGNGGAINVANGSTLKLSNSTIRGNSVLDDGTHALGQGGGIYNAGILQIINCRITNNKSISGGAIYNTNYMTVTRSVLSGNEITEDGGGIYNSERATITASTIADNTAGGSGGGIENIQSGALNLHDSTVSNNSAGIMGGGIDSYTGVFGEANIINSTISGNHANESGGGISLPIGTLVIANSTIANNRADFDNNSSGDGGGLYTLGMVSAGDNIFAANFKGTGNNVNDIVGNPLATAEFNLVSDPTNNGGMTNGTQGNIVGQDAMLGPLQDNGGRTWTQKLLRGSPAIDAGSNAYVSQDAKDQRGLPRIQFTQIDLGAYEVQPNLTFLNGNLSFSDSDNIADELQVQTTASQLVIQNLASAMYLSTGALVTSYAVPRNDVVALQIDTGGGKDRISFDFATNGYFPVAGQVDLEGGTEADTILVSGNLNYSLDNAHLQIGTQATWNLHGLETAVLQGGAGRNRIDASAFAGTAVLDGGDNNDVLIGGSGRDILIGGLGRDVLNGGSNDDILIGGEVALDIHDLAVAQLFDLWSGPLPYAKRVAQIRQGTGLPAGIKLVAPKVPNDAAIDKFTGNSGRDWFWAYSGDVLKDRRTNEVVR